MKKPNQKKTDNELIAEFMGDEAMWFKHGKTKIRLYDTSWDWLMPVVEKIETLRYDTGICGVVINGEKLTEVIISPQVKNDKIEVHYRTGEPKIICTYKAVVAFIKWYNEQNK